MDLRDLHSPLDLNKSLDLMTPEERMRAEHQMMHEKHKGHEAMHDEMVLILLLVVVVTQFALFEWKIRHYRSYSVTNFIV